MKPSIISIYPGNAAPLSLAIPLRLAAPSTGDGFSRHWEKTASSV